MQLAFVPLLAAALSGQLPPQEHASPVLLSGGDASWIEPETQFGRILGATINRSGEIAIGASLVGTSIDNSNSQVSVLRDAAGLHPIARQGDAASLGFFSGRFLDLNYAVIGGAATYFPARVVTTSPFPSDASILVKAEGASFAGIIAQGETLPPGPWRVQNFGIPAVSAGDGSFFDAYLIPGPEQPRQGSLWVEAGGIRSMLLKRGDQMPNSPSGTLFEASSGRAMNPQGKVAFGAFLEGPAVTPANENAIYSDRSGTLRIVARAGELAVNGTRLRQLGSVSLNDAGSIGFRAGLTGGDASAANDSATFFDDGARYLIAREGDLVPGFSDELHFVDIGLPGINADDVAVFYGRFDALGSEEEGVFTWTKDGGLQKSITTLDPVPELSSEFAFVSLGSPVLNAQGQLAFVAEACSSDECSRGIWAEDAFGKLRAIALTGQQLRVGAGDWRTVLTVDMAGSNFPAFANGNESGEMMAFNDDGLLTFNAFFTDNSSGVFVVDTRAIPEPSSLVCAVLCAGGLFATRIVRQPSRTRT